MDIVKNAHAEFDRHWAALQARAEHPTTCRRGCFACCSEPLLVNKAEAALVMQSIPDTELEWVRRQTLEWCMTFTTSGIYKLPEPRATDYLQLGLVCPLLKDGLCLVYKNRPLGCRCHNAIGDPKLCGSPLTRPRQKYMFQPELTAGMSAYLSMASKEADHLGVYLSQVLLGVPVQSAAHAICTAEVSLSGPPEDITINIKVA